jgi:hypothetical protein
MQDLRYSCNAPRGVTLPEDAARWETNRAENERQQAQRQRRRLWSATRAATRAWGEETPSEPESSGDDDEEEDEDEEEGEITHSPSPPPEDLPSLGDLFSQQAGVSVGARRVKRPKAGTGASSDPPPQSGLALVHYDLQGMSICTRGDRNNSLAQGFVGSVVLPDHRGCCIRAGGAILIVRQGRGVLVQEGPPLVLPAGVLSVCVWRWLLVLRRSCFSRF